MATAQASQSDDKKPSPAPQTPTPQSSYPQWTSQIQAAQIDPALLQQSQAATAAHPHYQYQYHYPYPGYHQYVPQASAAQTTPAATTATAASTTPAPARSAANALAQPPAPTTAASATTASASTNQNQLDTTDVAKLNDALGGGLVDLKAEEESLQRTADQSQAYRNSYDDRSHKQPSKPNFDTRHLGATIRAIGKKHKVDAIPEESVNYIALALRTRLQDLINAMISASAHRTGSAFDRVPSTYEDGTPMWSVTVNRDVAKQLAALEKAEREDEMRIRRERKELAAQGPAANGAPAAATSMTDSPAAEEDGPKKKKKKVEGPGVTAKNMPEDLRKKMSNQVASQAAGFGSKYSWMNAGTTPPPPKPKPAASSSAAAASPSSGPGAASSSSTWMKPYVSSKKPVAQTEDSKQLITLRDALFVIEKDRGHGGGRGSARGWS